MVRRCRGLIAIASLDPAGQMHSKAKLSHVLAALYRRLNVPGADMGNQTHYRYCQSLALRTAPP